MGIAAAGRLALINMFLYPSQESTIRMAGCGRGKATKGVGAGAGEDAVEGVGEGVGGGVVEGVGGGVGESVGESVGQEWEQV